MDPQRIARITGILFLVTYVTSIPALALYQPVLDHPAGYIAGGGHDTRIYLGAFLEMLLIVANIGTAVVLFPVLRRQNEILASRLRHRPDHGVRLHRRRHPRRARGLSACGRTARGCGGARDIAGRGQGLDVPARPGLHRRHRERADPRLPDVPSGLVPPRMALLGLIGGPLIILSGIGVLFDVFDAGSPWQAIATIPEFLWELSLGIYLTVKGFRPVPVLDDYMAATRRHTAPGVPLHSPGRAPSKRTYASSAPPGHRSDPRSGSELVRIPRRRGRRTTT